MKMNVTKPTRLDLENIDINQITQILSTGDLDTLPLYLILALSPLTISISS